MTKQSRYIFERVGVMCCVLHEVARVLHREIPWWAYMDLDSTLLGITRACLEIREAPRSESLPPDSSNA